MLTILASLMILQATTARAVVETPLDPGRWVIRETVENGSGLGGISASLASDDGLYRLVVRCDYSYDDTVSLQFLPVLTSTVHPVSGTQLKRRGAASSMPLVWESAGPGVFARDGEGDDNTASEAAADLATTGGALTVDSRGPGGERIHAAFVNRSGRDAIARVRAACSGG